jgi:hypothetical protein
MDEIPDLVKNVMNQMAEPFYKVTAINGLWVEV